MNDLVSHLYLGPEPCSELNPGFFTSPIRRIFPARPSFLNLAGLRPSGAQSRAEAGHSYGAGETHTNPELRLVA